MLRPYYTLTTALLRPYYALTTGYFFTCSSRVKPLSLSHFELRSLSIASVIRSAAPPWRGVPGRACQVGLAR